MAKPRIVILGAGLGGAIAAFEIKDAVGNKAEVSVVSQGDTFHFVPSNPWVAVHWRKREAIEVKLPPVFKKRGVAFTGVGAKRISPATNQVELNDGTTIDYDYLVIATGPELAFDEIPGLGPHGGFTQSVCHVDHAETAAAAFDRFVENPGPIVVGAVQGASCFGPAYEFAMSERVAERSEQRRKRRR